MGINLTIIGQTITFIVFVAFCMKFVWPPVMQAMEARRKEIADGLAAGDRAKHDLEKAREEAEAIIREAREQAGQIRNQANQQAGQIQDQARAEATAERERQVAAAQAEIEQEANRIREELAGRVGSLAVTGAERILAREIDADRHRDLLDKLAAEV